MTAARRFVVFPLGRKRFALPAEVVAELAQPDRLQEFPHTTPLLTGVLVRRGHIIPVCDVAQRLVGRDAPARRFYLIANSDLVGSRQMIALPVTGECELVAADMREPAGELPPYVLGLLSLRDEFVEVLKLESLMSMSALHGAPARLAAEVRV